jgi:four helix bundle protein
MAGVNDFTELIAWQLANELQTRALELSERPSVLDHRRYRSRLTNAAASGPRQIADGFGRFKPHEFAHLVRAAKASECQVLDLFGEARRRGFLNEKESGEYVFLARRAIAAATGLIRYLENTRDG